MKLKQLWNEKTKKQKAFILSIFLLLIVVGAYAAVNSLVFHRSWTQSGEYVYSYDVEVTDQGSSVGALLPGDSFSIDPIITSKSTGPSYVFLRIDCKSVGEKPIYTFEPTGNSEGDWTVVSNKDGEVLVVYGSEDACTTLNAEEPLKLTGRVKLNVDYKEYATLDYENSLLATFHVCGVHAGAVGDVEETSREPVKAYEEYIARGGE